MAYRSKYKGKEIDNKLDLVQELSEDISAIKEEIKNTIKEETDPVFSNSPAASITEEKKAEWDNKVDKVSGKQLSTEDFTTILKTKLEGLSNYDDTELSKALSTLRGDFNKLVSGDTTTAIKTFNEIIAFLDGIQDSQDLSSIIASIEQQITAKQDRITDLDAIRRGAEKGATAVQPASLADYISKDDVDAELSETSTNPIQNQAVKGALLELVNAIGIFLSEKQPVIPDLEAIRAGATKGATALQSSDVDSEVSETSTNPVQNKVVAGALNEIVGLLESTLLIIGGRFDSKQDTLVSGENIKTVNGESILGEGNITIEGGGGGGGGDLSGYATEEYVNNAVNAINVKGEDGYVYSNGEKVDMRFTRSLIPVGTSIPAKANLNTVEYLKVGKYYCSLNADAKTITNCPTASAFMMEVFNLLSTVVDNEVDSTYVYRIRIITEYSTGIQYFQYCTVGSTANRWTYDSWYVCPRTKFTLNSNKNDGSAAIGSKAQGVYVDSTGTLQKMTYSLNKTVPANAVFTDTDTKVTAVGNHYTPVEDESVVIEAPDGEVVIGLKRDAAGHVVGVMSTPMSGGGSGGGITKESDPVFSASPAATITEDDISGWNNDHTIVEDLNGDVAQLINDVKDKQDAISDLETIRDGAAKGATALQYYVTSFDLSKLLSDEDLLQDEVNKHSLLEAIRAKKLILMPIDNSLPTGYITLNCFIDDMLYIDFVYSDRWCHIETGFGEYDYDIYASEISFTFFNDFISRGELASVATSGSYNDLVDKPTIPSAINIAGTNYTPSDGGIIDLNSASLYRKPSGGIPKEDFSSEVQTSLRNAEAYKGTVTGVKINGTTKSPSNGVVDLGDVPTSIPSEVYITDFDVMSLDSLIHNDILSLELDKQGLKDALAAHKVILVPYEIADNTSVKGYCTLVGYYEDLLYIKVITEYSEIIIETSLDTQYIFSQEVTKRKWQDKQDTLKSGENIKTINGESILGSGNITISGGGGTSGSAQLPANYISSNIAQGCIIPSGKVTIFSIPQTEGVTMRLSTVDMESGKDSAWVIRFSIGADNTGSYVVEPEDNFSLKWANGIAPTFENGKYYEMSFRLIGTMFLGVWASFE